MAKRKIEVQIIGDAASLTKALGKGSRDVDKFGRRVQGANATVKASVGGMLSSTARLAAGTVGIYGVARGFMAVGKSTVDFDKGMRNVNSIAQLSERDLGKLQKQVLSLAGKTAQAPKTLADGLYDLVSSGFNSKQSMLILASSAKAATAGLTDTGTSTKAVAAVLNAYRRPAQDAANVSDTLFQTVNRGVISFEDLSQNIGDVLPFASSLKVPLNAVGASISTMTKAGISAPETMTRLKGVMVSFIKPSEGMAAAIKGTGAASGEALIKQKGFQGALEAVIKTTDGSKASVAKLFPDIRALGGAMTLTGSNTKAAREDLEAFRDVTGATDKALKEQSKSIAFQWNQIKAVVKSLSIQIGSVFIPMLSKGFQAVGRFAGDAKREVGQLADKFRDLKDGGKSNAQALGTILSDGFKSIDWRAIGGTISKGISGGLDLSKQMTPAIEAGISRAVSKINGGKVLSGLVTGLSQALTTALSPSFWIKNFSAIFNIVTFVIPIGKILKIPGFGFLFNFISKPIFGAVKAVGSGLVGLFSKVGSSAVTGFIAQISKTAPRTANVMLNVVTFSGRSLGKLPGRLRGIAGRAGGAIVSALEDAAGKVGGAVGKVATVAVKAITFLPTKFFALGKDIVRGLIRGIASLAGAVKDKIEDVVLAPYRKAKDLLGISSPSKKFHELGAWVAEGFALGMESGKARVRSGFGAGLLFPLEAGIARLTAQRDALSASFEAWDRKRERRGLVQAISDARSGSSGGGSGGGSVTTGGGRGGSVVGGSVVAALSNLARKAGLTVTSTTGGKHAAGSNHYKGLAVDAAGSPEKMMAFARMMRKRFGGALKELFHDPFGGFKDGKSIGAIGGHGGHVHVAARSLGALRGAGGAGRMGGGAGGSVAGQALAVARSMGAGKKATLALIEAGLVESGMRNLKGGDRDSVGFLQQRPSQGWKGLRNVPKAAREFLSRAMKIDSSGMTAGQLAQAVQRSAFPGRYDGQRGAAMKIIGGYKGGSSDAGVVAAQRQAAQAQKQMDANQDRMAELRRKSRALGDGKDAAARRKVIAEEIADLVARNRQLARTKRDAKAQGAAAKRDGSAIQALREFDNAAKRARRLAKIDVEIKGLERVKAFKDAIEAVRSSIKDRLNTAVDAFRDKWEKTTGAARDAAFAATLGTFDQATETLISEGPAVRALQAAQDEADRIATNAEDASNQKALADATKARDTEAIAAANEAIARTARERNITRLQGEAEAERNRVTEARAVERKGMEDREAAARQAAVDLAVENFRTAEQSKLDVLTLALAEGKLKYAAYAKAANAILATIGGGALDTSADAEATINAGPYSREAPKKNGKWDWGDGKGFVHTKPRWDWGDGKGFVHTVGRAQGGMMEPGRVYEIGELGRERVTVSSPAYVTQASQSRGGRDGGLHFHGPVTIGTIGQAEALAHKWSHRLAYG